MNLAFAFSMNVSPDMIRSLHAKRTAEASGRSGKPTGRTRASPCAKVPEHPPLAASLCNTISAGKQLPVLNCDFLAPLLSMGLEVCGGIRVNPQRDRQGNAGAVLLRARIPFPRPRSVIQSIGLA